MKIVRKVYECEIWEDHMTSFTKKLVLAAAVVAAPLMAATSAAADGEKYILVSHAPDSDS